MRSRPAGIFLAAVLALVAAGVSGCRSTLRVTVGIAEVDAATVARAAGTADAPLLLDVRAPADYAAGHIGGAVSVQPRDLDAYLAAEPIPAGRRVVTVCYSGRLSLLTAPTVRTYGVRDVRSLAGGMAAWRAAGLPLETGPGRVAPPGPRRVTLGAFATVVVFVSGMLIKPAYMLLSLVLIVWLWRVRTASVIMVRRALALFLLGEALCALDFFVGHVGLAAPLDWLHGFGMVAFGALLPWGLFRLLDERVLRFGDPDDRCVFQRFCGHCWKREPVSCGAHRLFIFVAPALALVALMPLSEPLQPFHLATRVNDSPVNYGMPVVNQILEFRLYPILACLLMLWTLVSLRGGVESVRRAQLPFFVGLGFLGFSVFRFLLLYTYRDVPHWSDFWEETTELATVLGTGLLLFVFRRQLALPWPDAEAEAEPAAAAGPAPGSAGEG